mgnify:CR=1 FL=1
MLRVAWRAGRVFVHLLRGLATIVWQFPRLTPAERDRHVQAWAAAMLVRQGQTLDRFNTLLQFTRLPLSPFVTVMGLCAGLTALVCLTQSVLRLHAAATRWRLK